MGGKKNFKKIERKKMGVKKSGASELLFIASEITLRKEYKTGVKKTQKILKKKVGVKKELQKN